MTICPIQCGICCNYWRDVFPDPDFEHPTSEECQKLEQCFYLGRKGCKLPRAKRPEPCTSYICERGCNAEMDAWCATKKG